MADRIEYPPARQSEQRDVIHGVEVADPYRWLENPDSPETRTWIEDENALTRRILGKWPGRDALRERLEQLWNYERYGVPYRKRNRWFYSYNSGLQNQASLYVQESLDGEPRLLLDPNELSTDGTVALTGESASEDGTLLAYALSQAGSDWQEWHVREVATGKDRDDRLQWSKFSGAEWTHDGKGFFYSRFSAPAPGEELVQQNYFHKVYYHRLGQPQDQDTLVYERPDQKEWYLGASVTEDGRYLLIFAHKGTEPKTHVFVKDLGEALSPGVGPAGSPIRPLLPGDAYYGLAGSGGTLFWFVTDLDAPRRKVVQVELDRPARSNWAELIPEARETIQSASIAGNYFFVSYLEDAHTMVRRFALDGSPAGAVGLPGIGTASGFDGTREDHETCFSFTSFTTPGSVWRCDASTGAATLFRQPALTFDADAFETRQVFFASADGTRIPMFLTFKKRLEQSGANPTVLYGYGGFNAAVTPAFSPFYLAWMEMGGIYAVANLRGGGEYGEEWHQAGTKRNKQNVFDDFMGAAEWLIANRYTSQEKLAITGGSNGGLLVGACLTQRPDLFGAALPHVGVMDMLRFDQFTVGWGWTSDYGSPSNPEEFHALYAYSPLHNIRQGKKYPPTLVFTGDHDDRVAPAHSFKFAAALQAAQQGDAPVLIRIDTDAGHGMGKPVSKAIDEAVDKMVFLCDSLGVDV